MKDIGIDLSRVPLCPNCGNQPFRADHVIKVDGKEEEGVLTLCAHCFFSLKLEDGAWRVLTEAEALEAVKDNPFLHRIVSLAFAAIAEGRKPGFTPKPQEGHA